MWAHIWAPMQPPPTFNFGQASKFFFVCRIFSMRQKTKNQQNQGSIDKKFDFFHQSPTHIPRWVHLVQKTRAKNSHAWAPLKVPKRENFSLWVCDLDLDIPIWVCDLGSGKKIDFFIK